MVVKQTQDILPLMNNYTQVNKMVDVIMRSILPTSWHVLSTEEVTDAIERHLRTKYDLWPSWTVRYGINSLIRHFIRNT